METVMEILQCDVWMIKINLELIPTSNLQSIRSLFTLQ